MNASDSPLSDKRLHWAAKYIGLPYELAARGPTHYDCWGLLWTVYCNEFHIELPEYPGITCASTFMQGRVVLAEIMRSWIEVEKPFDGAAVAMSTRTDIHHVGVYISPNAGRILHATPEMGVVACKIQDLQHRGFRVIKFYQHKLWPTL